MKYLVEKRIINNYLVEVEAKSPEEAVKAAYENDHDEGELTSENEDGDTFYPSAWRVFKPKEGWLHGDEVEFPRHSLKDLD